MRDGKWTQGEIATLEREYVSHGPSWGGWKDVLPGRSYMSIAGQAHRNGFVPSCRRYHRWTKDEEVELLRMRAKGISYSICANRLGVTKDQVKCRLARLKSIYREGVA